MFDEHVQAEMFEDMVAVCATSSSANGVVQSFDNSAGETFIEIVQEFLPPVLQSLRELYQLNQSKSLSFVDPCP